MPEIKVLSKAVADQIAAGEVAERPAAVVKELVENAMDAGARRIAVEIKNGGIKLIRVTDNGCGIPAAQVETAFLRHATSKLNAIEDLDSIQTMGFRGEALASICAVAEVEVVTKTADEESGTYLAVKHGEPSEKEEIACNDGTTMLVKNLFANVPARMKFLKRDATEAGYVADLLGRMALARPDIALSYTCDGKEIFATTGDGVLQNAILKIYGMEYAKELLPVSHEEDGVTVTGVVGKPALSRGNRTRQTLFVNGRYIKNHVVSKVIEEAFRNMVMVGKFPFFVLDVAIAPACVDVNVHPAKTEIKFANEKKVYDIVFHAVNNALHQQTAAQPDMAEVDSVAADTAALSGQVGKSPAAAENAAVQPPPHIGKKRDADMPFVGRLRPQPSAAPTPKAVHAFLERTMPLETAGEDVMRPQQPAAFHEPAPPSANGESVAEETSSLFPDYRIIGQVFDTYILLQEGETLCMIDQHAAHERLRFELLKQQHAQQERISQQLLTPLVINLSYAETETVLQNLKTYAEFGFEIAEFGTNAVLVSSTPVLGDTDEIRDLVLELAEALEQNRRHPIADFEERALDLISCKYAIKANKKLTAQEMEDLVFKVYALERASVYTCPHGRPIKVTLTKTEVEKMFKRKL